MSYNQLTGEVNRRLAFPRYDLTSLASIEVLLQYGCSSRATEEPIGYPILRMNNLQADGWRLADLKYVELTPGEFARWRLLRGDIVFNRTNSKELVGKCEVFDEPGEWVFASYLMRLRVDRARAIPEFIAAFLNTPAGRVQIDRLSRQIVGMANINGEEIRTLRLPLPDLPTQSGLLTEIGAARLQRKAMHAEADARLEGLDAVVHKHLGLPGPEKTAHPATYAVRLADVVAGRKLYPDYFHPERLGAIRAVADAYSGDRCATLHELTGSQRVLRQLHAGDTYLGLSSVRPNSGELDTKVREEAEGAVLEYATGDVLFARLRPYLNKVYRAEQEGVCSPEFHVLRTIVDSAGKPRVLPDYLAAVLRSSVVLGQTRHMMTGNTHPRLASEDVGALIVPVPGVEVQARVAAEVESCRVAARRLRMEADMIWEKAKAAFEAALLGSSPKVRSKRGGS